MHLRRSKEGYLRGTDFEEFAKHFNADVDMHRWGELLEKRSNLPIRELKGLDEWPTKADFPLQKSNKRKSGKDKILRKKAKHN